MYSDLQTYLRTYKQKISVNVYLPIIFYWAPLKCLIARFVDFQASKLWVDTATVQYEIPGKLEKNTTKMVVTTVI